VRGGKDILSGRIGGIGERLLTRKRLLNSYRREKVEYGYLRKDVTRTGKKEVGQLDEVGFFREGEVEYGVHRA